MAIEDKIRELEESLNKLKKPVVELSSTLGLVVGAARELATSISPFTQVQTAAAELAKSIGLSSKSIMSTATRTIEQNKKMQLSMSYNISTPEMIRLQETMMSRLGRNVAIDQVGTVQKNANGEIVNPNFDSDIENLIAASKVFDEGTVGEIVAGFDKLGMSMKSAAKVTGKLYKEASEYGINLQEYTANFTHNLDMAQMYNFRNGVNGLKEMARKATEIRQNMQQIASFANTVGTVTGAVETAANLQVLGGSFAALSNPLAMLNESLTDMNGLQDRFNQMTKGAATYNSVTHQIEMDPVTRQLMKRAAQSMGIDPNNFIDQAYAQARKIEVERQIDENGIGGIRDDVRKLLPNIAEIDTETGIAGATIGGEFRTLSEIASMPKLQDQLIEETRSESEDIKTIAKSVMTIEEKLTGFESQARNEEARNKIIPGAVSGLSSYEIASRVLNEEFTPEVLDSARKIDLFTESIETFAQSLGARATIGGVKAADAVINSESPQQARGIVEEEFKKLFGDSDLANSVSSFIGSISAWANNVVSKANSYTTNAAGLSLTPAKNDNTYTGQNGREIPLAARPTAESDLRTQATYSVSNGSNPTINPGTQSEVALATAMYAGRGTEVMPFEQFLQERMENILSAPSTGNNGVKFSENQQSLPQTQVAPTSHVTQTNKQTQSGSQQAQTFNYNLNLSGALTMDIKGDNGKIGTADIMKLLENNPNFARELAKAISEAIVKLNGAGMIQNP